MTFETLRYLTIYWWILRSRDFASLYERVRHQRTQPGPWKRETIQKACTSVDNVCAFLPMQASCLLRSAVLTTLLRRRGAPVELVIGATRLPFKGHAWVELNGEVLNDKPYVHEMYATWDRI